jgi:hypothetical protein
MAQALDEACLLAGMEKALTRGGLCNYEMVKQRSQQKS